MIFLTKSCFTIDESCVSYIIFLFFFGGIFNITYEEKYLNYKGSIHDL